MFEYIKFNVGGYFYGCRSIEIYNHEGELEVVFNDQFSTLGIETSCSDDGWADKLADLKINEWKDEYFLPCCDGTQWELDYKVQGRDVKHVDGSNDYPENWLKLIDLVEEFHPKIDFMCHDEEDEEENQ